jgi:hypothetical protein
MAAEAPLGLLDLLGLCPVGEGVLGASDTIALARLQACSREARSLPTAGAAWRDHLVTALEPAEPQTDRILAAVLDLPGNYGTDSDDSVSDSESESESGSGESAGNKGGCGDGGAAKIPAQPPGGMTAAQGRALLTAPPGDDQTASQRRKRLRQLLHAVHAVDTGGKRVGSKCSKVAGQSRAVSQAISDLAVIDWAATFRRHGAALHMARRRTRKLVAALASRDLKLRSDSWLSKNYISEGGAAHGRSCEDVVDKMEEMAYFYDDIRLNHQWTAQDPAAPACVACTAGRPPMTVPCKVCAAGDYSADPTFLEPEFQNNVGRGGWVFAKHQTNTKPGVSNMEDAGFQYRDTAESVNIELCEELVSMRADGLELRQDEMPGEDWAGGHRDGSAMRLLFPQHEVSALAKHRVIWLTATSPSATGESDRGPFENGTNVNGGFSPMKGGWSRHPRPAWREFSSRWRDQEAQRVTRTRHTPGAASTTAAPRLAAGQPQRILASAPTSMHDKIRAWLAAPPRRAYLDLTEEDKGKRRAILAAKIAVVREQQGQALEPELRRLQEYYRLGEAAPPQLRFPAELSSAVRADLHQVAEGLGLEHWSQGDGVARHLVVCHDRFGFGAGSSSGDDSSSDEEQQEAQLAMEAVLADQHEAAAAAAFVGQGSSSEDER